MDDRIDYDKVFEILPEIMGFSLTRYRNKWISNRRINGEIHHRFDKLSCRKVKDGIQILEQGGESMTLFNWMVKYGGCATRKDAYETLIKQNGRNVLVMPETPPEPLKYVSKTYIKKTTYYRRQNGDILYKWLCKKINRFRVAVVFDEYQVGSTLMPKFKVPATVFWYVNEKGRILYDRIIAYNNSGHRRKDCSANRYFRKYLGFRGRCLFGSHLLAQRKPNQRVMVVESEKTALMAKMCFRNEIWLATGGKTYLRKEDIKDDYTLIADIDAWDEWHKKFPNQCPQWWKSFPEWKHKKTDDFGDYLEWRLSE